MEEDVVIKEWNQSQEQEVISFIVSIQHDELGVNITAADQPDLKQVPVFYQKGNGNFWVATHHNKVVGTIALTDIGNQQVGLRKMFVHSQYRGKEKAVATKLMNTLFAWCRQRNITDIYLGTIHIMKAAHRFYERNGFVQVAKNELPSNFPIMGVDDMFYCYHFNTIT